MKYIGFLALTLTVVFSLMLVVLAVYNVSLWQDGARPPNELSRKILAGQAISTLILVILVLFNLAYGIVNWIQGQMRQTLAGFVAAAIAFFAILFAMIFDSGAIFFQ